jgi:hypothetical protein
MEPRQDRRRAAVTLTLLVSGASLVIGRTAHASRQLELQEERRYGVEDDSLRHGGAALANITALAETTDSILYALDAGFNKVVAFAPNGELRRLILGGHGEGPGEFLHPIALDITDDGRIAVFDYPLNRVTLFDREGTVLNTVLVRRAKTILVRGDTIWGTNMPGRDYLVWRHVVGQNGFHHLLATDARDWDYAPQGSVARIARAPTGVMLVARHRPGVWMVRRGSGDFDDGRGTRLTEESRHRVFEGIPIPPGDVTGFGVLPSGRILMTYTVREFQRPTAGSNRPYTPVYRMALFSWAGQLLGTLDLGEESISAMAVSRTGESVFLARPDPFPQVIRYKVHLAG